MVLQHLILYTRGRRALFSALQTQQRISQQQQQHQQQNLTQRLIRLQELEAERLREQRKRQLHKESLLKLVLRDISNPWLLEENQFIDTYRLTPHLTKKLVDLLYEDVAPKSHSNGAIPGHLRVFIGLRFFGRGPYQTGLSKDYKHPCAQATISRIINKVTDALIKHSEKFINFPKSRERRAAIESRCRQSGASEGTLGFIDVTLVHLSRPCSEEEAYYNHRHGCHCISCEVVCDPDYLVLSFKPLPGSNADPFLWKNSKARETMERTRLHPRISRQEKHYYLLADAGYTDSPVIFSPIANPQTDAEKAFNDMLTHNRCKVEQLFGQLKGRWRCINKERMLHYKPKKVVKVITACIVLHNFAKLGGEPIQVDEEDDLGTYDYPSNLFSYGAGIREKERLIRELYA
ncbi:hypothetical protein QAD02_023916 [Eretmocerus hayati]|uniref:Uncharacterized protein n=2 Tax=Eretmocerus hayati TaxID=131215 RepID=A0ACC2PJF9_9HYME|nr:hypothetical protein QAD02_018768 [Eretmocerus hayati]KAJ8688121.1 hypothetical protein QAD02_023916 [Eretmocerus hayati]